MQKIKIGPYSFEQAPVYGLDEDKTMAHPEDMEEDCVICMSMPKNTMVMPCRHVCMCDSCTELLQKQSKRNCPVCRENVTNFIRLESHEMKSSLS
jgi:hypothetical protein